MNEDADASTIFIASKQVGNEYRATEIKGNTVSGKEFTITPKQLFEKQFADGGGVGEWKVGDKVSGSLVGSDYKENGTVIHVLSDGIVVSFPNGDEIKFDYDELEGMKIENKYAKGGPVLYGFQGADPETFVLNNHLGYGKIITNNSEGSDILFFDENRKKYFFKTILKGNQDTILKPKGIGYNRTGAKFNISKYFTPQMIEQYPTTDLRKTFAKGGGVGSGDDHITALGSFYQATSEFESKYKVGANQKLQKIVGKELYYKSEDGKKWFWNNPVIKKMTASELNALTKKIQDQMPGEKGWKHRHKA